MTMKHKTLALLLGAILLIHTPYVWGAASKQFTAPGTAVTFADSAQTPTVVFTLSNLVQGTGQYSARYDKGAGSQPSLFQLACHLQLTGTNVAGSTLEVYIIHWDAAGNNSDGNLGTTTAALATDKRRNLKPAGLLVVDQTVTNTTMSVNLLNVYIPGRYVSIAIWNATGIPTKTDTAVHGCALIPMPPEMQ